MLLRVDGPVTRLLATLVGAVLLIPIQAEAAGFLAATAEVKFTRNAVLLPSEVDSCALGDAQFEDFGLETKLQNLGVLSLSKVFRWMSAADTIIATRRGDSMNFASRLDWYYVYFDESTDVETTCESLSTAAGVLFAEPVEIMDLDFPNDPFYEQGLQWGLYNPPSRVDIHAPEAWGKTCGSSNVRAAIIDMGVWYGHQDFGECGDASRFTCLGLRCRAQTAQPKRPRNCRLPVARGPGPGVRSLNF